MKKVILCLGAVTSLFGGSVRLYNDSPYTLRAVIRGADGTYLGEMVINPQHNMDWNDSMNHVGFFGQSNMQLEQYTRSQTPYTVLWYCMDGWDFSICNSVPSASTVTAQTCPGARQCRPHQKQEGPFPNEPTGPYSHPEQEIQNE